MSAPTVFLSAATIDLELLREVLDGAFREAGFHVLTHGHSLGMAPKGVRDMIVTRIGESHCVIHLAGLAYGSDAIDPFADAPDFRCSWTQFEYYYARQQQKPVLAFVCGPDLCRAAFEEEGDAPERERKAQLQQAHRARVASGTFANTPLDGAVPWKLSRTVNTVYDLLQAVAGAVREVQGLENDALLAAEQLTLRSGRFQLPPRPSGFVGRESDLAKLRTLNPSSGAHITGLKGMGGIGKTALALVLAHEWAARFPDAQLFLDGRGTQADPPSARKLMEQVVLAFHPTAKLPDDEAAIAGIYRDVLGGKRVLILLDNARDAAQANPLIPPAGCALIVTSRHTFMLGTVKPHDVGRLPDGEAVALLREFHPALTDADAAALVKLCAGLPLALRLAGAHLALDGDSPNVAAYLQALGGGRLKHLDAEAADAGEVTISETLRLSEAQLPAAEREAWRRLGVFTASFDARAAAAVARPEVARHSNVEAVAAHSNVGTVAPRSDIGTGAADSTLECRATEELLRHFVRRSLLEREGAERYRLHDLAADYARAQLGGDALAALHLAHARHYTAVGQEAERLYSKGDAVGGLALFDRERAQIEAAFEWSAARLGGHTASTHSSFPGGENASRGRSGVATETDGAPAAARQLIALVNAVAYTGDLRFHPRSQRIPWLESQLRAARLVGDKRNEGNALGNLGNAHADLGDARKAIEFYEQHAAIAREIGDRRGEGNALGNLGIAHATLGDARKAIEFHEQSLVIKREIGNRRGEGNALYCAAVAHDSLGNRPEAIARAAAALAIYEAIEDPNAAQVRATLAEWRGEQQP